MARTNPAIREVVRHTGPRPCAGCLALDGKRYKHYQEFRDHPNGQCYVDFDLKSPEELGIDLTGYPINVKRAWERNLGEVRNRLFDFYELPESQQRKLFANNLLYDLWKSEKFPFEKLAVYKNGSYVQASYSDLISRLDELGGISYPVITFPSANIRTRYNSTLDPNDRASDVNLYTTNPSTNPKVQDSLINKYGQHKFPLAITDEMIEDAPIKLQSQLNRLIAGTPSIDGAPWFVHNSVARVLDLGIRYSTSGVRYYVD